jgi:hypothetical protein
MLLAFAQKIIYIEHRSPSDGNTFSLYPDKATVSTHERTKNFFPSYNHTLLNLLPRDSIPLSTLVFRRFISRSKPPTPSQSVDRYRPFDQGCSVDVWPSSPFVLSLFFFFVRFFHPVELEKAKSDPGFFCGDLWCGFMDSAGKPEECIRSKTSCLLEF